MDSECLVRYHSGKHCMGSEYLVRYHSGKHCMGSECLVRYHSGNHYMDSECLVRYYSGNHCMDSECLVRYHSANHCMDSIPIYTEMPLLMTIKMVLEIELGNASNGNDIPITNLMIVIFVKYVFANIFSEL